MRKILLLMLILIFISTNVFADFSFIDNDDGTVTDKRTGLLWLKNTNCTDTVAGIDKSSGSLNWHNAETLSCGLADGACGLTDGSEAGQWRQPTKDVLHDGEKEPAFNSENRITVLSKEKIKKVNKNIFGTNVIVDSPFNRRWFSDYASGFWNPVKKEVPAEIAKIVTDTKISMIRVHSGGRDYQWKDAISDNRTDLLFGVDEFISSSKSLNAEPVLIVNYHKTSPESAAELVKYTKGRIKYFEIGNEIYNSQFGIAPQEYANRYLQYYALMKAVDPTIQLGLSLRKDSHRDWNAILCATVKDKVDFGVVHKQPYPYLNKKQNIIPWYYLYEVSQLKDIAIMLKDTADKLGKPIALTEFGGGTFKWEHRFYRYSLSNALINADMIKILLNSDVLFANNFELSTIGAGMVNNRFRGRIEEIDKPYIYRPKYYLFKLYADHFKDNLIKTEVVSEKINGIEYLSVVASMSDDKSICVMIINRKDAPLNVDLYFKGVYEGKVTTHSLVGDTLESHNEDGETVSIKESTATLTNQVCNITFPKYSVTAVVVD